VPTHGLHRLPRTVRIRAAITLIVVGVVASLGGIAGPAASAAGAAPARASLSYSSLSTSGALVTSSSHTKLQVFVDAFANAGDPASSDVSIFVAPPTGNESHTWRFKASAKQLRLGSTGSINLPLGPYGVIKLHYKPAGKAHKQSCDAADYAVNQKVSISGKLAFNTRSSGKHKWGKFARKHFRFHAGSTVTRSYGEGSGNCHSVTPHCASSISYSVSSQDFSVFMDGFTHGKRGSLNVDRTVQLSTPHGAVREDDVTIRTAKPKVVKGQHQETVLKITTAKSGSFALTYNGGGQKSSEPCKKGKHKTSEQLVSYGPAVYKNGKPPLVVHEAVFGPIRMPKSTSPGDFSVTTA
jgi:hypothetical protein